MRISKIFLFTLLFISLQAHAKKFNRRSFGIGASTSAVSGFSPGFGITPYAFYANRGQTILAGPILFSGLNGFGSIIGVDGEYRRRLLNFFGHMELYASCDFQYFRFSTGPGEDVAFHFHKNISTSPPLDYSMIQFKSFNNTIGGVVEFTFKKRFSVYLEGGIGYNYSISNYSQYNVDHVNSADGPPGKKWEKSYLWKLGIHYKIWKEKVTIKDVIEDF